MDTVLVMDLEVGKSFFSKAPNFLGELGTHTAYSFVKLLI